MRDAAIAGRIGALGRLLRQADTAVLCLNGEQGLPGVICRTIINHNDFQVTQCLLLDTLNRPQRELGAVVCRNNHADAWIHAE